MKLDKLLYEVTKAKRGIKPAYTRYHVLKCLLVVYREEPIGRLKLSKILRLSETTVRTLISRLKELNIVCVDRVGGVYLTSEGREIIGKVMEIFVDYGRIDTAYTERIIPHYKYAYYLKLRIPIQTLNIKLTELRDIVIRCGGEAALILTVENGKLYLPYDETAICEDEDERLKLLRRELGIEGVRTILIAFSSKSEYIAEKAAIETLIELLTSKIS
ncbi:MAG TPA: DUF4443 domain-containing protein [Desulfurococcales archaeon]|nr:DUF4443 domain-containing protein [Desulfurococcales archaeon]